MMKMHLFDGAVLPDDLRWFNPPRQYCCGNGLELTAAPRTDFWQRTHYGFRPDNGHALFMRLQGDFSVTTRVCFAPVAQYDQCGLMVRRDEENWIKLSTELEDSAISRLGSVVTNLGYSDWATQDVPSSITERWYRIQRTGSDFLLEHSEDGADWSQMRMAHLHQAADVLEVGPYACSPLGDGFSCRFFFVSVEESLWHAPH